MEASNCWTTDEFQGWKRISIKDRIDSFNFSDFEKEVKALLSHGSLPLAFELSHARFLSFKTIQLLNESAEQCRRNGRRAALVAPTEKLKRQIHIYADLEQWEVYRTMGDLISNRTESGPSHTEGPSPSL